MLRRSPCQMRLHRRALGARCVSSCAELEGPLYGSLECKSRAVKLREQKNSYAKDCVGICTNMGGVHHCRELTEINGPVTVNVDLRKELLCRLPAECLS